MVTGNSMNDTPDDSTPEDEGEVVLRPLNFSERLLRRALELEREGLSPEEANRQVGREARENRDRFRG